ncbi:MAG: polysulfide reductase NrfD [Chloroflexi bacterium]|nr:polysulfide reductase NrfD [Chloroflexota bacterium]
MGPSGSPQISGYRERLEDRVLSPLTTASRAYYLLIGILVLIIAWGIYAYTTQLRDGLYVTGLRDRITWGMYITLFVFFIGISHAGTLISAILRVSKAEWRVPVTRMAEFITVVALMIGALMPLIDLGRPDRVHHLFMFGRWQAPITWDILAITTYFTGSLIYLYLPLIPDFALARDRLGDSVSPFKRVLYRTLAIGWRGSPEQRRKLHVAMGIMMILIIPIAVSVHTVVSWIFGMTLRDAWNNPEFGVFFVAGAIYSGIAALIILMVVIRKAYHLEEYLTPKHFINLGYMLAALSLIMMYFNILEYVTEGYKLTGESEFGFNQLFTGALAPYYWFYAIGGLVIPGVIILIPWTRNIPGILVASILVVIGMWMERYFIVVGGLRTPTMPYEAADYFPSWVEWSIMTAAFAGFILIITIAVKILPVIAIWEVAEVHDEHELAARGRPIEAVPPPVTAAQPAGGD